MRAREDQDALTEIRRAASRKAWETMKAKMDLAKAAEDTRAK